MNRIFKVIWSKTKNCYVVASELAKGRTKAASTGDKAKRLALAAITALMLLPVGGYSYAADTTTVEPAGTGSTTTVEVYTKEGTNSQIEAAKKYTYRKAAELDQKLTDQKTSTALHVTKAGNLIVGTKENQIVQNLKINGQLTSESISTGDITSTGDVTVTGKMAADGVTDETTKDGTYVKQNNTVGNNLVSLDKQVKANDDRITNVKEYLEQQTSDKYVSKADAAVQDGAIVKAANTIGDNVTKLDAALAKETAARIGADKAQDAVIQQVNQNAANGIATLATAYNNEVASREAADNELNERITNEANAIHDEIKAGDTALDNRITAVKESLQQEAADTYVSKDDASVQDGAVVKANNKVGQNVQALDTALAKETAARIGADKAQDQVIAQVNQNMVDGFNTINTNMANGFAALNAADAAEKEARIGADKKLAEAVNSGLSLSDDNVLQKNTTTVADDGTVTTSKIDAKEMILNNGKDNQITLNENGIKVGTNSSVMDKDGVYTGGDSYSEAKAALKSNGSIKGADGKFTVNSANGTVNVNDQIKLNGATGVVKSNGLNVGDGNMTVSNNGNINTVGTLSVADGNFKVNGNGGVSAAGGKTTLASDGSIKAADGKFTVNSNGGVKAADGKITLSSDGSVKAADGKFTVDSNGAVKAANGNTTIDSNGNLKTAGTLSAADGSFKVDSNGKITSTGLDAGNGTIQTTGTVQAGDVKTGTLKTTGDATIGGNLTVDKNLTVNGEFNAKTLSSKLDENNYTTINGGKTQSVNLKLDAVTGETKASASTFDETGSNMWAKDDDSIGKSTVTADVISQKLSDTGDNPTTYAESTMSQGTDNKYTMTDTVKDGDKTNVASQSATESSNVITDENKNTSTFRQKVDAILQEINNADNTKSSSVEQKLDSINSKVTDGTNTTSMEQGTTDITNKAEQGTISNIAKDLVNTATGDMTNTVGGKMLNDVTGDMENKVGGNLTTMVGGNETHTVGGTLTETVTGKATENYNGGLETTITGEEKHTVNGDQTNTITGKQTTTVIGDVTEDYKANLSTTVGGNQTTTVTGDSSLTAENITNEAKNKITNKALDVETDASSSIVSKVSNEYGSNTSTQLSYQTTEEMSQADGKKASYLRGAAEEKSQLTDGDKKTTIDTVAGQTNTNITDGTNTSNSLQKADQVASSVTDGTNTTVVNQDAKSLASSITDGTKANNTNNTVDKSEQLIKANDTQYSATTKTATKMEDALVSGSNIIDVIKGLDAAGNPLISSAVTDGTTITGISQNAKDINLSAAGGTITNDAQNITNKAAETLSNSAKNIANTTTEDMTNTIGKNLKTTVGGDMSTEVTGSQSTTVKGNQSNTVEGTLTETVTGKATENYNGGLETTITGEEKHTVNGDQTNTITGKQATTVTGDSNLSAKNITNTASEKITNQIGDGSAVKSEMTADGITNTAEGGTIYNKSKDILNEASGDILNFADGEIGNVATKITNITGDNTVTSDTNGTTFENKAHNTAIKEGTVTKTTISGNTIETGQAKMDYAEVMKDLGVHGNATVDQKLTVKGDSDLQGNANVGKNLTVNGTSDLKGNVTMESNATVQKDLTVNGTTTTNKLVVNNGATIKGGTTTDTLHVTSTSTFDGAATFKDVVTMEKDLSVGGNATVAGSMTASSYKVGDKTYISESGINANNQKVVNVAAGDLSANSTDAVNGAQLYQTNERVTGVENKVNKLDSRVDKVGANAAALANLHPLEFDADSKWNIAAAVGGYKGETATAIGAFYRPNENVMVNVSSSFGTGENMYGGGISLRIGQGGNKARRNATNGLTEREKAMQKQIDSLTSRLDALLSVINPNMSKDFPDVPENHWAYEAVSRLAGNGVIQGYEDGKYHGDRTMTRYEMAEIIYNALSKGAKAEKKLVEEFKPELQAMAAQKKA